MSEKSKPRKSKKKSEVGIDEETYQRLLNDLSAIIDSARSKGVDFGARYDLLDCQDCEAFEDISDESEEDHWVIYNKEGIPVGDEPFIIIDHQERQTYYRKSTGTAYFKIIYKYICTNCGAMQETVLREKFDQ